MMLLLVMVLDALLFLLYFLDIIVILLGLVKRVVVIAVVVGEKRNLGMILRNTNGLDERHKLNIY